LCWTPWSSPGTWVWRLAQLGFELRTPGDAGDVGSVGE